MAIAVLTADIAEITTRLPLIIKFPNVLDIYSLWSLPSLKRTVWYLPLSCAVKVYSNTLTFFRFMNRVDRHFVNPSDDRRCRELIYQNDEPSSTKGLD